jgi:hypothetical protein
MSMEVGMPRATEWDWRPPRRFPRMRPPALSEVDEGLRPRRDIMRSPAITMLADFVWLIGLGLVKIMYIAFAGAVIISGMWVVAQLL